MFKPETWQSHGEYRTIIETYGRRLFRNNPRYHFDIYNEERMMLLNLDLAPIRNYISRYYSTEGHPTINQTQILRSLALFVLLFNRTSLTLWVRKVLPNDISLAILCGFESTDRLPPLGSYYDLMNRLWLASREHYSRTRLLPAGKNGKKPEKVIGTDGKLVENDSETSTTKTIVDGILRGNPATDNPEAALQEIFTLLTVLPSIRAGLIDAENLTLSGDGTAVTSHSSPYGRHLSSCDTDCTFRRTCQRHYSDPDAD